MATMSELEKASQMEDRQKDGTENNGGGNPLERIERLLTCPICLDRYKQPKLLSCQHTFCLSCLENYVESSGIARPRIRCPECRGETALSDEGNVQALPTNLTLLAFLEIHLEASDVNAAEMQAYVQRFNMERCRICEEKAELEPCAHCDRKCCSDCRRAHLDMLKRDLGRLLGQVRRLSSRIMDASKGLTRGLEQLSTNGEQTKSEIREYFNRYQKELRRREENFLEQVDVFVQTEERLMRTLRDALDVEWNNLQDACIWVDGALGGQVTVRDDELTRFKTVFAQGLEYLRSFQPDLEEHFAKKVRFSPGDDAAKLPTAIANFGELNVSLPQFANRYLPLEQQYLPRPFRLGLESDHFLRPEQQRIGRTTTDSQHNQLQHNRTIFSATARADEGDQQQESAGAQRWRRRRELEEEAWSRLRAESSGTGSAWTSGRATPSGAMSPLTVPLIGVVATGDGGSVSPMPLSPSATTTLPLKNVEKGETAEKKGATLSNIREQGNGKETEKEREKTVPNSADKEETRKKTETTLPKGQLKTMPTAEQHTKMATTKATTMAKREQTKETPTEEKGAPKGTTNATQKDANGRGGTSINVTEGSEDTTISTMASTPKKETSDKKAVAQATEQVPTFTTAQTVPTAVADSKNGQAGGSSHQQHHRGRLLMINGGGSSSSNISSRMMTTPRRTMADANGTNNANPTAHQKPPLPARQFSAGAEKGGTKSKAMQKTSGGGSRGNINQIEAEMFARKRATEGHEEQEEEEDEEEKGQGEEAEQRQGRRMQIQSQTNRFRIHCRSSSHGRAKLDMGQPIPVAFFPDKSTGEWSSDHSAPPLQSGLLSRSRTNPDLFAGLSASSCASLIREALEQRPRPKERRESRTEMASMVGARREESAGGRRARRGPRDAAKEEGRQRNKEQDQRGDEFGMAPEEEGSELDTAEMDFARVRPRPRLVLGGRGTAPDQMNWPRGICALPSSVQQSANALFAVADSSNHRVQIFCAEDGTLVRTFGTFGTGDGQFDGCCAVCVSGVRRELLVADRYNHRVQVFDFCGTFLRKFGCQGTGPGQFQQCWGIAVDEQFGLIYVADKDNHRIQMFDVEGAFLTKFGTMGDGARQFNHPLYLTFHPQQRLLFVSDSANNRISVFAPDGTPLRQFGGNGSAQGQLKLPRGIVVDSRGRVIVADSGNNRVQFFSPAGICLRVFGTWGTASGQFKGVEGVCLLRDGQQRHQLVVADRENNRVQLFA